MLKEPVPGRVKTRLGRDIGMVQAAHWFRTTVAQTLRRLDDPRWDIVLAVSPDETGLISRFWPENYMRVPQGRGDLGARMLSAFAQMAPHPTCIIGGDIPDISKGDIWHCFAGLGSNGSVICPSGDGGYWLVGLRHPSLSPRSFMRNVRWSSPHAMRDTMESAPELGWHIGPERHDIDTGADLLKWQRAKRA